jgi:hypothetical protein
MLKLKLIVAFLIITSLCSLSGYVGTLLIGDEITWTRLIVMLICSNFVSFQIAIRSKFIYQLIEDDHLIKYGKDE